MEPPRTFLNKTSGLNYSPAIQRLWSSDRCAVHHLNNRRAVPWRAAASEQRRPRLAAHFCTLFLEILPHLLHHYLPFFFQAECLSHSSRAITQSPVHPAQRCAPCAVLVNSLALPPSGKRRMESLGNLRWGPLYIRAQSPKDKLLFIVQNLSCSDN